MTEYLQPRSTAFVTGLPAARAVTAQDLAFRLSRATAMQ
jgi:hypothetical protein